ncbi:MAG TPA: hypothetical protein VLI04_01475, partial [Nocardioidaceae bacterium]|nr:hypothetical protein [Nocardioidaceae bacterium]
MANGLPYFVDDLRAKAKRGLSRQVFLPVALVALVVALVAGFVAGHNDRSTGVLGGVVAFGAVLTLYGFVRLEVASMGRWAVGRTLSSLGLLFPLVTRALPLLLLFVTFLFINTEVWQVASNLDNGVLWVAVLLFATVAVGFLLVRLPEELDRVDDEIGGPRLAVACQGTPLEGFAPRYTDRDVT